MNRYIDQDKVIDAVLNLDTSNRISWLDAVIDMIDAMPSEDVRPVVHGEWIKTMEGNAFRDKCSEYESLYPNAFGYNWCPNCCAKMDRKGADE